MPIFVLCNSSTCVDNNNNPIVKYNKNKFKLNSANLNIAERKKP